MIDNELLILLTQTIAIATLSGYDGYGKATYGSSVDYACRINSCSKMIRTPEGQEKHIVHEVWLGSDVTVTTADRVTLPDNTTPSILTVEKYDDENGPYYTKLYLGW